MCYSKTLQGRIVYYEYAVIDTILELLYGFTLNLCTVCLVFGDYLVTHLYFLPRQWSVLPMQMMGCGIKAK